MRPACAYSRCTKWEQSGLGRTPGPACCANSARACPCSADTSAPSPKSSYALALAPGAISAAQSAKTVTASLSEYLIGHKAVQRSYCLMIYALLRGLHG